MKNQSFKIIVALGMFLSIINTINAQPVNLKAKMDSMNNAQFFASNKRTNIFKKSTAKTTVDKIRLIATGTYCFDGSSFSLTDTSAFEYWASQTKNIYGTWAYNQEHRTYTDASGAIGAKEQTYYYNPNLSIGHYEFDNYYSGTLIYSERYRFSYTSSDKRNSISFDRKFPSTIWKEYDSTAYDYDASGNEIVTLNFSTNFGTTPWRNHSKLESSYDVATKKNLLEQSYSIWDTANNIWVLNTKKTYSYDASGNNVEYMEQGNSLILGSSTYLLKQENSYDASGNITESLKTWWDASSSSWQNGSKLVYNYFGSKLIFKTELNWNNTTASYDSVRQYFYTYDAIGNTLTSGFAYIGIVPAAHVLEQKFINAFDSRNNLIESVEQRKNASRDWYNYRRQQNKMNSEDEIQITTQETWDATSSSWVYRKGDLIKNYYYEGVTSIDKDKFLFSTNFNIFPNPNLGVFTISSESTMNGGTIKVYDLMGKVIYEDELSLSTKETLIQLNAQSGIYIVSVQNAEGAISQSKIQIL